MNPILGPNSLHPFSALCGTHYREFHSAIGIRGLAKESNGGKTLHLLAVNANPPGIGQFRTFMAEAKKQYTRIYVWEIRNPILETALSRYGFAHTDEVQYGDNVSGMVWVWKGVT